MAKVRRPWYRKKRPSAAMAAIRANLVLTPAEKRVILFVVVAACLGITTKHYRDAHSQVVKVKPGADKYHAPQPRARAAPKTSAATEEAVERDE